MARILIENLKPIKNIEFDLKQVNLFIGPQSSGKSTILKVICFCRWLEKHIYNSEDQLLSLEPTFKDILCTFHRISKNAFTDNTIISYKGDFLTINYKDRIGKIEINVQDPKYLLYKNNKLAYIPSERNFVSSIHNLRATYKSQEYDNILNYVYEWTEARESYQNRFSIKSLGIDYLYNKEQDIDRIFLQNNEEINLTLTSSGFQSVIPLFIQIDYYTHTIFGKGPKQPTVDEKSNFSRRYTNAYFSNTINDISFTEYMDNMREYQYSQLFIEEPEQNLFPTAQVSLLDEIVKGIISSGHDNYLFMSTHSPYILARMNNLIEASETGKAKAEEVRKIIEDTYWLPYEKVNAFYVDNGIVESLMNDEYKMISGDKIDMISEEMNELHYKLSDIK